MKLIAHRGLTNENIKENTLEAFINAIENNYDGIELDIRLTKDKKIVVLHDKLINRTSDGKGNINNLIITVNNIIANTYETPSECSGTPNATIKLCKALNIFVITSTIAFHIS